MFVYKIFRILSDPDKNDQYKVKAANPYEIDLNNKIESKIILLNLNDFDEKRC